jgi:putative ATPase
MVSCPICGNSVNEARINLHIDSECQDHIETLPSPVQSNNGKALQVSSFFRSPAARKLPTLTSKFDNETSVLNNDVPSSDPVLVSPGQLRSKRLATDQSVEDGKHYSSGGLDSSFEEPIAKRLKPSTALQRAAPFAERMRPQTLDDVYGQELVGPDGVLRGLIEADRVPSMILWGGAGTGKTTIARVIAHLTGGRSVEINSTNSGVAECKKIFAEAKVELGLTGRKTIIFCDEIHRFSKSQQDVFLGPVESGQITLIGATTENPSFKVQTALLSRCRTFTLKQLTDNDVVAILKRALVVEGPNYAPSSLVDEELIKYLAAFAEGDARTALNLLELAMNLSNRPSATQESIKAALTKTLVYDRAGDQHCKPPCLPIIFTRLNNALS